jgi:hypothetical protein
VGAVLGLVLAPGLAGAVEAGGYGPGREDLAVQVRVGGFWPSGEGRFWDDLENTFTLDESDFNDVVIGFSIVRALSNHVEIGFNADFYDASVRAAVRGFEDEFGFPILHDTRLETLPLTVDLRFLPAGRYRERGHGRRVLQPVVYLGGGAGFAYWEYEEVGDFVDFRRREIFFDRFAEDGIAFEIHGLAGLELPFGHTFSVLFEGRYSWADDEPGGDFAGLGELDLGGFSGYIGGSWRF